MYKDFLELSDSELLDIVTGNRESEAWQAYPFYPLNSPGMPEPGANFVREAERMHTGDVSLEDEIAFRYLAALYMPQLAISVEHKGVEKEASIIPGHVWGFQAYGPRDLDLQPDSPRVLLVSKMPGNEEAQACRNFVGPSGKLLKATFEKFGIPQETYNEWYVCNVCRWPHLDPRGGELPDKWIKDCAILLAQEIRLFRPDYILCIGSEATKAILGPTAKVSALIGDCCEYRYPVTFPGEADVYRTAQVIAVTHPAAVLRFTERLPQFEFSIKQFSQLVHTGAVEKSREVRTVVLQKDSDLRRVVDRILSTPGLKKIAVDAEWEGKYPANAGAYLRTVQFTDREDEAYVVPVHDTNGDPTFYPSRQAAVKELMRLLDRDDVQIIGHFFSADLPWLARFGVDIRHRFRAPQDFEVFRTGEYAGGFDTSLAAHAYEETAEFKLELQAGRFCGAPRWDRHLQAWAAKEKRENETLLGYGKCPDEILYPYGACDVAYTLALRNIYAGDGTRKALLDSDRYGNSCWKPFHISMLAFPAFLEMHMTGLLVDLDRVDDLTDYYTQLRDRLLEQFREKIRWPDFNPRSFPQCVELLFGERYSPKIVEGKRVRIRPEGAISFYLKPIKSSGRRPKEWSKIEAAGEEDKYNPAVDKEVCSILGAQNPLVFELRDIRFIDQILKSVLRPPDTDKDGNVLVRNGRRVYSGGHSSLICADGRLHTYMSQHKETGRAASSRPPLQNLSKRREADYSRIAGDDYKWPVRSFLVSDLQNGYVFVESDYKGAELFKLAVMAQDKLMIEHCLRSMYPEDHPDYYDIHSNVAVRAFRLSCPPTKKGLEQAGKKALRIAAKATIFGVNYGRGPEALARQIKEEGTDITVDEVKQLIDGLFEMYSAVPPLQERLRRRAHDPCWIRNAFGRYRRCIPSDDRAVMGELERQFMNFPMQSGVADAISTALFYLETHPAKSRLGYRIALQIHDAILFEVPIESVEEFVETVLPECMVDRVSFKACDPAGVPLPGSEDYHFQIDVDVCHRWGEKLSDDIVDEFPVLRKYA